MAYISCGEGKNALVFLHVMGGAADIWWQQILALKASYIILAPTYPAIAGIDNLAYGVSAIMEHEGIDQASIVGTSLGGYLAQYFVRLYPAKVTKCIFSNTFAPNDIIAKKTKLAVLLAPLIPEIPLMRIYRKSIIESVYPASGYNELVKACLLEKGYGLMTKDQLIARYRCVIDKFTPPDLTAKQTYPLVRIATFHNTGHFTYLNRPEEYTVIIRDFLRQN